MDKEEQLIAENTLPLDVEELYNKVVSLELREGFREAALLEKAKMKEYRQRSEVKAKKKEYHKEYYKIKKSK